MRNIILSVILLTVLNGCKNKKDVEKYLTSENKDSLIIGAYLLETKDTTFIMQIFNNPYDSRITHKTKYYGQSVYQAKMKAMERISKKSPPAPITNEPDSSVVDFYRQWAIQNGYIK